MVDPSRATEPALTRSWPGTALIPAPLSQRDEQETAVALCEPEAPQALRLRDALVVEPAPILAALAAA